MSRSIQFIPVPFISAYDIFQYTDNVGLTISTTGNYYILKWANDGFNFYPSGFQINVSGSGYWQGSGFAFAPIDYLYDIFAAYPTGFTTGYLLSGTQVSGYNIFNSLPYSGFSTSNLDYMYDNFASYPTGNYNNLSVLLNADTVSGFSQFFPNNYSGIFNLISPAKSGANPSGSPLSAWYTVADSANSGYIWSGINIGINPGGASYLFNINNNFLPGGGYSFQGPFSAGGNSGSLNPYTGSTVPYPWTGGGPTTVGNVTINATYSFAGAHGTDSLLNAWQIEPSGVVQLSGVSGAISGDFTLNVIWNWKQFDFSPVSNSNFQQGAFFYLGNPTNQNGVINPGIRYEAQTGHGLGLDSAGHVPSGGAQVQVALSANVISGGPQPQGLNFGDTFVDTGHFNSNSRFEISDYFAQITSINQDTPLIDYDMISGFAIYLYSSIWSGNVWQTLPAGVGNIVLNTYQYAGNNYGSSYIPSGILYTGIASGVVVNPYVYILGNKISGNLIGPNAPTGMCIATGITSITGASFGNYDQFANTGNLTGCFGFTTGYAVNGPMAQFSGFGFGMAQYLTVTRTGTLVSIYQSGILFATGYASGNINTSLPLKIGQFNRPTGVFNHVYSGFGLYHLELWNYCQSAQTIASNVLTYIPPPQTGLILSTNFVLK